VTVAEYSLYNTIQNICSSIILNVCIAPGVSAAATVTLHCIAQSIAVALSPQLLLTLKW